jgi:hypothetical protein
MFPIIMIIIVPMVFSMVLFMIPVIPGRYIPRNKQ